MESHLRRSRRQEASQIMRSLYVLWLICLVHISCSKEAALTEPSSPPFWETEEPVQLGFDSDTLDLAYTRARNTSSFYVLLVIRHGKIAAEASFNGRSTEDLYHLRSITKNFTSALTDIALQENILNSVDDEIAPFFPSVIGRDQSAITLRHLLNMTSGLTWNEDTEVVPLINFRIADPVQTILSRPLDHEPGNTFNYNSVSPHIVSYIIAQESGTTFLDYAHNKLLAPLGIVRSSWEFDPNGHAWGGFGLQLRARDLAKFGKIFLDGGIWEGQQLLTRDWVEQSQKAQVQFDQSPSGYSLQWWTSTNFGGCLHFGLGFGGQALMIVPTKDLIVVAYQEHLVSPEGHKSQWRNFADNIFPLIYRAAK